MKGISTAARQSLFRWGCIALVVAICGDPAMIVAMYAVRTGDVFSLFVWIGVISAISALLAIVLIAYGKGWRRIMAEGIAVPVFLGYTAFVLIGFSH